MPTPVRLPLLAAVAAAAGGLFLPSPGLSQNPDAVRTTEGLFVAVPSPITSEVVQRVKNQVEARVNNPARPVKVVVFDFTPQGKDAANPNFGACYELSQVIDRLKGGVTTVAFVSGKAGGHTVLPVLACRELVMARGGRLGEVADGPPPATELAAYDGVTKDRKLPAAVVRKFFDKNLDLAVGVAKTGPDAGAKVYFDRADGAAAAKLAAVGTVAFAAAGQVGSFTADQARELGLATALADTRADVAELYDLPPTITEGDLLQGRAPDAYQYKLTGEIDGGAREALGRIVRDVRRKKGNMLFLTLAASGGDLEQARRLADDLREAQTGDDPVVVVGFIPDGAPDAAAFVALGCTEIVMSRRKDAADGADPGEATLGDFAGMIKANPGNMLDAHRTSLKDLAEKRGVSPLLIDGLFDKELVIVQVQGKEKRTVRRLMSEGQYEAEKDKWAAGPRQVKPRGQYLKLTAALAEELGVARFTVDARDPAAVYALYGLDPAKVRDVSAHWIDRFAEFLRNPAVTVILVVIGFTGLILEFKVPGLTVPGIVAALCFILVFWSQSRFSGEMFVLALLLFLLGLGLLALEIFVLPGFGAPGITGILCMLAGLGLVTFDRVPQTTDEWGLLAFRMVQYLGGVMGAGVLAYFIARFLPNVPYANRMLLSPPSDKPGSPDAGLPGTAEAAGLLGAIGTANTPLRPAGVVRFADRFVDVVSDGGFIPAGTRVQVVTVEGTRIVVKEV